MWKGEYREFEAVVGRVKEEGKKRWIEKRGEKGRGGGREWKEDGKISTLCWMGDRREEGNVRRRK